MLLDDVSLLDSQGHRNHGGRVAKGSCCRSCSSALPTEIGDSNGCMVASGDVTESGYIVCKC